MKNSNKNREKLAKEWFSRAHDNELSIKDILDSRDGAPSTVCFLSQQLAEKYLKGYLVYKGREFLKIHQLERLIEMCADIDKGFNDLGADASDLSVFYISTRYPGDFPDVDFKDAEKAYGSAAKIKNFVLRRVNESDN
jgi:HEPN domain-containing protein